MNSDEEGLFESFIDENIGEIIAFFDEFGYAVFEVVKFEYETTY